MSTGPSQASAAPARIRSTGGAEADRPERHHEPASEQSSPRDALLVGSSMLTSFVETDPAPDPVPHKGLRQVVRL